MPTQLPRTRATKFSRREGVWLLLWVLSLSTVLCCVSENLNGRFQNRQGIINNEFAILSNQPLELGGTEPHYVVAFQNRVLFPLCLEAARRVGILSMTQWFVIVRILHAAAMFAVFYLVLRFCGACSPKLASLGSMALAYVLIPTLDWGYELTSDLPDALFTGLMLAAVLSRRFWVLAVVALGAATNRESAAFAGVLWAVVVGLSRSWRAPRWIEGFKGAALSIVAYAMVLALRHHFGGATAIDHPTEALPNGQLIRGGQAFTALTGLQTALQHLRHHFHPFSWPLLLLAMLIPLGGWVYVNRRFLAGENQRIICAAALIALISLVFGNVEEIRIFIPCLVLLCYVAVALEAQQEESTTPAESIGL